MSSSEASSTSSSPTLPGSSFSPISLPAYSLPKPATSLRRGNSRSLSMSPIPEDSPVGPSAIDLKLPPTTADQARFFDISADIKSTLTDLLNCETVRKDSRMRMWVQSRLMDAELELKRQRKRKRCTPTIVVSPSEEVERNVSV
ncbi:hypothetical protein KC343_g5322 [Hortaea werneckii]|uniref:Uncharacterized protein n=1 Tax=Hortaea werneckii TaxID=91943 RepID=A0A3M7E4C3_HORWE|nr:hypothetical protein KC352_g13186 [Hortaea werneckii]KAI7566329.1 hypothetical protein KC317_g5740 [Hortaea werneckii]KAI7615464.1 hypothetical protein KC346_g6441 [Hortaea werneckii]KAI7629275.1 hypothetical protein KC343_g5322 [Hortaea werneckii]KAI7666026.1 hypothetical protein KC319_g7056 [Hortaea werneckii]